jgi:cytochrome c-type biogenesis protein CcmH
MTAPRSPRALLGVLVLLCAGLTGAQQTADDVVGVDKSSLLGEPAGSPRTGEVLDAATEDLSKRMRCPVCQGLSVADSPSASALAMKNEVRSLLADGYSEDQIMAYFESTYGEFVRLVPKATGFNWFVWLAPGAALIIGALLVLAWVRSHPSTAPEEDPELEEWQERVRQEVGS